MERDGWERVFVISRTWGWKVQLHPAQLRHGSLQMLYDCVVAAQERLGNPLLQELPELLQGHLLQIL